MPPGNANPTGEGGAGGDADDSIDASSISSESARANDFGVTLGAGKAAPQGRWHSLPVWSPVSIAEVIGRHKGHEAWFSLSRFDGDYRDGDYFRYAVGIGADLDTEGHRELTVDERKALIQAARDGYLPGHLFYDTTAGGRLIRVLDGPVFDLDELKRLAAEFEAECTDALDALGFEWLSVDPKCTRDKARFYYAPNAYAKGKQRKAEVLVLPAEKRTPERREQVAPPAKSGPESAEIIPEGQRNDFLSRKAYAMRKWGMKPDEILIALKVLNEARCKPELPLGELEKIVRGKARIEPDGARGDDQPRSRPVVVKMSDVKPEHIRWLWPSRIALGKLSLIAGDGGLGKSTMTLDIAARVSTGAPWPDGSGRAPTGEVLILSAEDDPGDTIRPRLDAAHADVEHVHTMPGVAAEDGERVYAITLADVWAIEEALEELPECKLVVIDPMAAYLGRTDSHVDAEIRGLLAPLATMAARRGVAVVIVAHLNKGNAQRAIYRVSGSQGTYNAVRTAWFVTADADDEDKRLMLPAKNNLAKPPGGLAFRLRSGDPATGLPEVAHVEWIDGRVDKDIDDALSGPRDEQRVTREDAQSFLLAELADGPVKAAEMKKRARAAGIGWRTVENAKRDLNVRSNRRVDDDKPAWWWSMPRKDADGPTSEVRSCGVGSTPPAEPDDSKAASPHRDVAGGFADYTDDELEDMADRYESE